MYPRAFARTLEFGAVVLAMTMARLSPDAHATMTGKALPRPALEVGVGAALAGLGLSMCLHRVGPKRATDWQPGLSIEASTLDDLLELLLSRRPGSSANWAPTSWNGPTATSRRRASWSWCGPGASRPSSMP